MEGQDMGSEIGSSCADMEAMGPPEFLNSAFENGIPGDDGYTANTPRQAPLSVTQRLWWTSASAPRNEAHNRTVRFRMLGDLHHQALRAAIHQVAMRQAALRTTIRAEGREPMQIIAPNPIDVPWIVEELCEADSVDAICEAEMQRAFDWENGPLMRVRLLQIQNPEWILLITYHPLIMDYESLGIWLDQVMVEYVSLTVPTRDASCPRDPHSEFDGFDTQERSTHLIGPYSAWRTFQLPSDHPKLSSTYKLCERIEITIPDALAATLRQLSTREGRSVFTCLLSAWLAAIGSWSRQDEVQVGVLSRARSPQRRCAIGPFERAVGLQVKIQNSDTVESLLRQVSEALVAASRIPDEELMRESEFQSRPQGATGAVVGSMECTSFHAVSELCGLKVTDLSVVRRYMEADLSFLVGDTKFGLKATVEYSVDLFDRNTVECLSKSFQVKLGGMIADRQTRIGDLPALTAQEHERVVETFNCKRMDPGQGELIHQLFEKQVQRSPDAIALTFERCALTYQELNRRANQLARYLVQKGVRVEHLVAICAERSLEMVVGLIGILKSGGAYVPLDPGHPAERLRYMLLDAGPKMILTQNALRARVSLIAENVITLDQGWDAISLMGTDNLDAREIGLCDHNLAYVIYTSGSTGKPKGAMNAHKGVVNRLRWMQAEYHLGSRDHILQKTPFSFDVSVWEFFGTLMTGAHLIVARPEGHKDPLYLKELIDATGITALHFVPSMLRTFLGQHRTGGNRSVNHVFCSGEELTSSLRGRYFECFPDAQLSNLYGPTETAVEVTSWECAALEEDVRVPIGRPIQNVSMYVLDRYGHPVHVGISGEIFIGGVAVGRGYLNRPELTAERFIPDPFSPETTARMYKTGDLGRWRSDGSIEYLGRSDYQVKIRGFRIELGEVEALVSAHPLVREVVVVVREDVPGDKRLVGYVTVDIEELARSNLLEQIVGHDGSTAEAEQSRRVGNEEVSEAEVVHESALQDATLKRRIVLEVRGHLQKQLPAYMVPSAFVVLEKLPLSPNGKLDRRSLPAPSFDAYVTKDYEPPEGHVEEVLAALWQELLHLEFVGRHDNFFELGGHSLLIVEMSDRLFRLGVKVDVRSVFETPTVEAVAKTLFHADQQPNTQKIWVPLGCDRVTPEMFPLVELSAEQLALITEQVPGGAQNIQDIYPLTSLQEGMLFHHLLNREGGDTYVLLILFSMPSAQHLHDFVRALQRTVDRHDVLRTAMFWEGLPHPVQVVWRQATLLVDEIALDLDCVPVEQLKARMSPESQRLDLHCAPLMRLEVAADPHSEVHHALLKMHHLIHDHASIDTMLAEVHAHMEGRSRQLPEPFSYRNHVVRVLAYASTEDPRTFFNTKFGDIYEPTVSFEVSNVLGDGSRLIEAQKSLGKGLSTQLRARARHLGVSPATLFHAAWALVVSHTSGRDDVVFGTVLLGRIQGTVEVQRALGLFINTLPLRVRLAGISVGELIVRVQREIMELLGHEQAALALAQRCTSIEGSTPLFGTLLNYLHGRPIHSVGESEGATGINTVAFREWTNYPISVSVEDLGESFRLTVQTDHRVDPSRAAGYLQEALQSMLNSLERAPQTLALELSILPAFERELVTEQFNTTSAPYPSQKRIHEIFEEQVERTPFAVAVISTEASLSYRDLNEVANRLARLLKAYGVQVGECIPVCMSRSVEMLVAQLAVLKCGAAYVPVDSKLPFERQLLLIQDCDARYILSDQSIPRVFAERAFQWISYTSAVMGSENMSCEDLESECGSSSQPAYVMYTSGSTGLPKGVVVPHRAVSRLVINNAYVEIRPQDRVAHCSNPAFDASTFEIWGGLLNGAAVVVIPQAIVLDASAFAAMLRQQRVSIMWLTVGLFTQYWEALKDVFPGIRYLLTGGDVVEPGIVRRALGDQSPKNLLNGYGPTECTTFTTTYRVNRLDESVTNVPIGRPIANTRIYILDRYLQPVPIGVSGEIYIGGDGVALGYLNRPELTAERFIVDSFSAEPNARLYKTGDLGRWLPDGNIEYLGRNDQQVKIRGFRIELGEIESHISGHAQVARVAVLARQDADGGRRLVAYVVPRDKSYSLNAESLREYLKKSLPEYMLPSALVTLSSFPLTANGKLDRRALPAPDLAAYARRPYEAPQGEIEEVLVGVWQDLLRVDLVGRHDNFFALGGHSLMIVQMMDRLRRIDRVVDVRSVYESQTLADLATKLTYDSFDEFGVAENLIPAECRAITPSMLPLIELKNEDIQWIAGMVEGGVSNIQDIYPLAPPQEGVLFHHLLDEGRGGDAYVVTTLLSVSSRARLTALLAAMQIVVDRHDVLRTAILWEKLSRPVQVVYRRTQLNVEALTLDPNLIPDEQIKEWMKSERQRLDLRRAPLMRLKIVQHPGSEFWYVLIQAHHITCDHETMAALVSEVSALLDDQFPHLPDAVPYRNHVARALERAKRYDGELYFRDKLADVVEPTAPFGLLDVRGDGSRILEALENLEPDLTRRLRLQARRMSVSAATLLHAAWALVVARTSGRDDVVFGTVLLGRLQSVTATRHALGMFVNTLPLRVRLTGLTTSELVRHVQRELIELLGYEQTSLSVAQRCSGVEGSLPLFTSLFNYRHSSASFAKDWSTLPGISVLSDRDRTNYPITVSVDDLGEGLRLSVQADPRVDPSRVIGYLVTTIRGLIDALECTPQTLAVTLPFLPKFEQRLLIEEFNTSGAVCPQTGLIHTIFEERVALAPESVAVVCESARLTYAALNRRANQLARCLIERGVGPDQRVGICVERGLDMVVALLSVLKAGGGYVPLDPSYPDDRLRYVLDDAAPVAVITQRHLKERIPQSSVVISLDEEISLISRYSAENLDTEALGLGAGHLAYIIYTSGSTGNPKGVMIEHRNVTRLFSATHGWFNFDEQDVWTLFHSFAFDFSVWELWGALLYGGRVIVVPYMTARSPQEFYHLLCDECVTVLNQTPSAFGHLAEAQNSSKNNRHSMRLVIFGGEALELHILRPWVARGGAAEPRLVNMYGITETTVHVTYHPLALEQIQAERSISVGKPISDLQAYLLDKWGQLVPIGVVGEIYVGGAGVARAYFNRPALTAERFIANPFGAGPGSRLYKTGDLGRWRLDGTLEYLGRNDYQVKVRGFRIELGEIESKLVQLTEVKEAVVILREDAHGEKSLTAYIVPRETYQEAPNLETEALRLHLRSTLPEHMIPGAFVVLSKFPLTANGKLDRGALPAPALKAYTSREYQSPQGNVENVLAGIWCELLRKERVGRSESFFDLGGHSLLALRLVSETNCNLGADLRVVDIYNYPTLQQLADRICGQVSSGELLTLTREAILGSEVTVVAGIKTQRPRALLLTGSTGFVGRFVLAQLLRETDVSVYCLIRAKSVQQAASRIKRTMLEWDLWTDDFENRIIAIPADLGLPNLGLDAVSYKELAEKVGTIYHCATSMNHLETYAMAKAANVQGVRELLKLAVSETPKLFNYISTLSVFGDVEKGTSRIVSEDSSIDYEKHSVSEGYAASKWVSEKIVMLAGERGIACNIFRLGLVWADSQLGRYDELQREYRLIKSCLLSGKAIRNYRYDMPPTPVDYVARAITYLATLHDDGRGVFHISSTEQMSDGVFERYNDLGKIPLDLMPKFEWVSEIRRLHLQGYSLPIVPLIEFAFSMNEMAFYARERSNLLAQPNFICTRTQRELEQADIIAPAWSDRLLSLCVDSMFLRDTELRETHIVRGGYTGVRQVARHQYRNS